VAYTPHDVTRRPPGARATLDLVRPLRRYFVKAGEDVFLWDRDQEEVPDEVLRRHFVHPDGFMRIPVLIVGITTAVRGFLPDVYSQLLATPA
jgi:hypothetical protein